jgi:pimeloyl-ACP methyl ester carboxylesterase
MIMRVSTMCCLVITSTVLARDGLPFHNDYYRDDKVEKRRISNHRHPRSDNPAMSITNMTCDVFRQPLNHFVPRGRSPFYDQRYCTYDGFVMGLEVSTTSIDSSAPIFFYTGNESPIEQYINHTGIIWELAPKYKARVVFVEHRYEGESLPKNISKDCMSYASTIQALADYARILEIHLNPGNTAPVIVFGGSYGGMLSAWMRMKYPHLVAGAIAASAPIGAFPQAANDKIDWSARVLTSGLMKPYPPNLMDSMNDDSQLISRRGAMESNRQNHCRNNLLAAWPLVTWLARDEENAAFLQQTFSLCDTLPENDATPLLEWAQRIWFDLAEGSFPYPSSYIPFALLHRKVNLPAWPMQAACWQVSQLFKDWGVRILGDFRNVRYQIDYGDSNISLAIDWDQVQEVSQTTKLSIQKAQHSSDIIGLLTSVRDAVSIWYNITKDVHCYNISDVAPNRWFRKSSRGAADEIQVHSESNMDPEHECYKEMKRVGSWEPLCCNDEMNLVITEAQGIGNDFFWPPSLPRGVKTYRDMIRNTTSAPCSDPHGIFGYSKEPYELYSTRLDTHFGGGSMNGHSNILFSNGLLDPWSAGGIYQSVPIPDTLHHKLYTDKVVIQNVTPDDIISLIIPFGGHHTDLMYSSPLDPVCVREARIVEETYIEKWIHQWKYHMSLTAVPEEALIADN